MSARVQLDGLQAFRAALRQLPDDLSAEGAAIVETHAIEAQRLIESGYPEGPTGNLKRGVTTQLQHSRFGTSALVRSRAPHASIFEKGTKRRTTSKGYNRGAMPQPPEAQRFIPKAIRLRARMTRALIDLVKRAGFEVSE